MDTDSQFTQQYLLIDSSPSVDSALLAMVIEDDVVSVDVTQRQSTAVKLLEANEYRCLITTLPESQPLPFLKWLHSQQSRLPLVVLLTTEQPDALNWAALTNNVYPLYHDPTTASRTAEQIDRIVHDRELTQEVRAQTTLRETALEILATLRSAETRDDLEATVCRRLAATDLYSAAWCSTIDAATDTLVPRTAAGIHGRDVADRSVGGRTFESVTVQPFDRSPAEVATVTVPLRHDGSLHGVLALTADREIDAAERDLLATLGANVGAAIVGLEAKRDAQSTDLPPLQTFSQTLSHELRNHLQTARSHLEPLPETSSERNAVVTVLDRIERLVQDARYLTRETVPAADRTVVQLADIVDRVRERQPEYDDRITVLESRTLAAQPQLLELLFENLFRNTVHHAGDDAHIRVGPLDDGFFVEDTGRGLPPGARDSLFDWSEDLNVGGGVGLAIVHRIVTIHEWEITAVESAERGARFEITGLEHHRPLARNQTTHQ